MISLTWRRGLLVLALAAGLSACGGAVDEDDQGLGGAGADAGTGGQAAGTGGQIFPTTGGNPATGGEPNDYEDPECPDETPPPPEQECDPSDPLACPDGLGCYPYLQYPEGQGCGFPVSGTACAIASQGEQGDFCGGDEGYCSPGFMCVVGGAGGTRCAQICPIEGDDGCPAGLICGETDVQGFGVCF